MTFKHGPIEVNYSTCVFHHALWMGPSVCCNKTSRMRMDYKLAALKKGAGQRRTVMVMGYLYIIIFSVYLACSDPPVGGYDYEFVDGSVPSLYQCTICMKVLRDARLAVVSTTATPASRNGYEGRGRVHTVERPTCRVC